MKKKKTRDLAAPRASIRPPATPATRSVRAARPLEKAGNDSPLRVIPLGLGLTFGFSLVLFGLALAPLGMLPASVRPVVLQRRQPLFYSAVLIYLATGLSLGIALLLS